MAILGDYINKVDRFAKEFWGNLFGSKNGIRSEKKQAEDQKIKLLAQIRELSILSQALIKKLDEKYNNFSRTPDKSITMLINKVKSLIEEANDHLQDAYQYLDVFNVNFTIDELVNAKKSINKISESNIDDLIRLNVFSKPNKGAILVIRSQVERLGEDLPKFNLKTAK